MTLVDELKDLSNKEIVIIMNDGQAYRGNLVDFDEDTIVMNNVLETSNQDIDWVESEGKKGPSTIKGYLHWRRITLPKLIVRNEMVLRIWPWVLPKKA